MKYEKVNNFFRVKYICQSIIKSKAHKFLEKLFYYIYIL